MVYARDRLSLAYTHSLKRGKNMSEYILEMRNIIKTYPGVKALDDVSLSIKKGEVHAIVGENGAGKSTFIKVITGAITPDSGSILYKGQSYPHFNPQQAKKLGIGCIYQEFNHFPGLTVAENILIFSEGYKYSRYKINYSKMQKDAKAISDSIGVKLDPKKLVSELSVGMQQIVEIARAVAENVELLIMDEPSAPLTNNEIDCMMSIIAELKKHGTAIIYISHRLNEVFRISDRVSVMMDGKLITTLNTSETNHDELVKHMIGRELKKTFPPRMTPVGEPVLEVKGLTGNGVEDISFVLKEGEILGFAGLLGCGRTETMQLIYGAVSKESGTILLHGKPIEMKSTAIALDNGIGLIPEDRKRHGGLMNQSIAWNITLSSLKKVSRGLVINTKKEKEIALAYIERLSIKTPSLHQSLKNLSGGNQQKVVVAKVLATNADIIIFDEPTRGIDVKAKQEIYDLMRELSENGKSIIMISSEMEEVIGLSDRVIVLHEGRIAGELLKDELSQETILKLASGQPV